MFRRSIACFHPSQPAQVIYKDVRRFECTDWFASGVHHPPFSWVELCILQASERQRLTVSGVHRELEQIMRGLRCKCVLSCPLGCATSCRSPCWLLVCGFAGPRVRRFAGWRVRHLPSKHNLMWICQRSLRPLKGTRLVYLTRHDQMSQTPVNDVPQRLHDLLEGLDRLASTCDDDATLLGYVGSCDNAILIRLQDHRPCMPR